MISISPSVYWNAVLALTVEIAASGDELTNKDNLQTQILISIQYTREMLRQTHHALTSGEAACEKHAAYKGAYCFWTGKLTIVLR